MKESNMGKIKSEFQAVIKKPSGVFLCFIAANSAIWAMALFLGIHWDISDDPRIAHLLRNSDYYYSYIGKGVSWLVHQLFGLSATVDWWTVFSVAFSAMGISVCVYSVIYKLPDKRGAALGGGILLIGWYISVYTVNFTRTAMVIAVGGISLILLALSDETNRKSIPKYICGVLLLLLGGQVRRESGYLALGFLALGGFIYLVRQAELFKKSWWLKNCKAIVLLVIAAVAMVGLTALEDVTKTDREKAIDSFDLSRSSIQDFNGSYSNLLNNDELCKSIGLSSSNDISMLINWMNDDPDVFTKEQLEKISEAGDTDDFIGRGLSAAKETVKIVIMSPMGILLLIVFAVELLKNFKKNIFPVLFVFLITVALLFCLCFMGRNPARVYESAIFTAIFIILFFSDHSGSRIFAKFPVEIVSCVLIIAIVWLKAPATNKITPFNEKKVQQESNYENFDLIYERKENTYFCIPYVYSKLLKASIWTMPPEDYCDNLIPVGGWSNYASFIIDKKEKYGIDNPLRNLPEKENAYLIFDKSHQAYYGQSEQILRYLREHYDPSAVMEAVDDIGTFSVVQYRSGN